MGKVSHGFKRSVEAGEDYSGILAWKVVDRRGRQRQERRAEARQGWDWPERRRETARGEARIGVAGKDLLGDAGPGTVWIGWVWFGQAGSERAVKEPCGKVGRDMESSWIGRKGKARRVAERCRQDVERTGRLGSV